MSQERYLVTAYHGLFHSHENYGMILLAIRRYWKQGSAKAANNIVPFDKYYLVNKLQALVPEIRILMTVFFQ